MSIDQHGKWAPGPLEWLRHYLQQVGHDNPFDTPFGGPIWDDGSAGGEYEGYDAQSANAHLIAAAPELYEALELAREQCRKHDEDYHWITPPEVFARIDAALAKARGEESDAH